MTDCLSKARTVAGRLCLFEGVRLQTNKDLVFARMGKDEQLWRLFTIGIDALKDTPDVGVRFVLQAQTEPMNKDET
jgi:hypothetical protein